ncbi:MAG: class I SAM-dependent methyltransferase [Desulfovibrio sp.]|nr:class I SAM-dependent methyltransferase [Desulfovibrio sp.]
MPLSPSVISAMKQLLRFTGTDEEFVGSGRYNYQLNCNDRGHQTYFYITREVGEVFAGKKILDVGCGFGGTIKAFSAHGSMATGIEKTVAVKPVLEANCSEEIAGNLINVHYGDASTNMLADQISDKFDLIVLEDVFEHVYELFDLLKNIDAFSNPGCFIYFNIPNRFHPFYIEAEAHRKIRGLSLLPPDLWQSMGCGPGWSIFYRPFEMLDLLLQHFGFRLFRTLKLPSHDFDWAIEQLEGIKERAKSDKLARYYLPQLTEYEFSMRKDHEKLSDAEFRWKYTTQSWRCIYKKDDSVVDQATNVN